MLWAIRCSSLSLLALLSSLSHLGVIISFEDSQSFPHIWAKCKASLLLLSAFVFCCIYQGPSHSTYMYSRIISFTFYLLSGWAVILFISLLSPLYRSCCTLWYTPNWQIHSFLFSFEEYWPRVGVWTALHPDFESRIVADSTCQYVQNLSRMTV